MNMAEQYQLSSVRLMTLITAIFISNFSTALDSGLSASSYVAVASAFNCTNLSTWPVNAFLVSSMTVQPIYAGISDQSGRRHPYLFASGSFAIGTILGAFSGRWDLLIVARVLCGVGVGGLMIMGSVVLTDTVGVEKRGYYQSMNYVVYGIGSAAGSALGGWLAQALGWSWIYKSQIPTILSSFLLLLWTLPQSAGKKAGKHTGSDTRKFDWRGSLCFSTFLITLCAFLTTGGNTFPWTHPFVVLAGICTVALFTLLLYVEGKAETPILPLSIFKEVPIRNLIITGFLFSTINYMVIYNIPMFFQTVLFETPSVAGLRLVIPSVSFTIVSTISASLIARLKNTTPTLYVSQALLVFGSAGLVVMVSVFPFVHVSDWIYNFVLIFPAAGASMMAPSAFLKLLEASEGKSHAAATAGFTTARSLGVFVAATLGTVTVQNTLRTYFSSTGSDPMREKVEELRKNIDLISTLNNDEKTQVRHGFACAYTVLFALCFCSSLLIVFCLRSIRSRTIPKQSDEMESAAYSLLAEPDSHEGEIEETSDDDSIEMEKLVR